MTAEDRIIGLKRWHLYRPERKFMNSTFLQSLRIMGVGMLGIFVVTIVLIAAMVILTKIFPAGKEKKEKDSSEN
jgi:hypothetical protein